MRAAQNVEFINFAPLLLIAGQKAAGQAAPGVDDDHVDFAAVAGGEIRGTGEQIGNVLLLGGIARHGKGFVPPSACIFALSSSLSFSPRRACTTTAPRLRGRGPGGGFALRCRRRAR